MQRIVFDANVWISAAAFPGSVPDQAIDLVRRDQVQALTSEEIIGQICRTLLGPRFAVPASVVRRTEDQIQMLSILVVPHFRLSAISGKDSDNRILECAVEGRADAIVTGDRKHLLPLGSICSRSGATKVFRSSRRGRFSTGSFHNKHGSGMTPAYRAAG